MKYRKISKDLRNELKRLVNWSESFNKELTGKSSFRAAEKAVDISINYLVEAKKNLQQFKELAIKDGVELW